MIRYIFPDGIEIAKRRRADVLIVGCGMSGLYCALHLPKSLNVVMLNKDTSDVTNSWLAQGGIAAALAPYDSPRLHSEDTLVAGAGLCDPEAVRVLVEEGTKEISCLLDWCVPFDKDSDGNLQITREGGHRAKRIIHAGGDATGRETVKVLTEMAVSRENITILSSSMLVDIIGNGSVDGALIHNENGYEMIETGAAILCTGGLGQVYQHTTNPKAATGDGLAAALRAGASSRNMEFVQFHPTGLYYPENNISGRTFLISEAVRGEGGLLRNSLGERFMEGRHPLNELAPRDIVARAIESEMRRLNEPCVFLDTSGIPPEKMLSRFPTITTECRRLGVDMLSIPVCPVQHYLVGGIETDLWGRTSISGLYACGEAACTGVHGANRLASNSMLECLVFGRRVAEALSGELKRPGIHNSVFETPPQRNKKPIQCNISEIQEIMSRSAGIVRTAEGMKAGLAQIEAFISEMDGSMLKKREDWECYNMALCSREILRSALARKESVGCHFRLD